MAKCRGQCTKMGEDVRIHGQMKRSVYQNRRGGEDQCTNLEVSVPK
jgi:hypothetical protein